MRDTPVKTPTALLRRTIAETPRFGRVVLLAAFASLTEGLGIFLLVPILASLSQSSGGGGIVGHWLPGVPLWFLVAAVIALVAVRLVVRRMAMVEQYRTEWAVVDRLRTDLYAAMHRADWRWLSRQRSADFVDLLVSQLGRIAVALQEAMGGFAALTSVAVYMAAAFLLSWQTAVVALLFGGLLSLLARRQRARSLAFGRDLGDLHVDIHRRLQEGVAGLRMARIVGSEAADVAALDDAVVRLRAGQMRNLRDRSLSFEIGQMASALLIAALVGFAVTVVRVPVATLLPFLLVIVRLAPMLERLEQGWQNWLQSAPALAAAHDMLTELRSQAEPEPGGLDMPFGLDDAIELAGVEVRYAGRSAPALKGVDLRLPAKTTTLIKGPSGAGKSTLADILTGLIAPDRGSIFIDGVALVGTERLRWRRSVAYVEQQAGFVTGTIRENLRLSAPSADDAAMRAALTRAAADFVLSLPDGLDSIVGDNGVLLSGGERQRIALARALLREPQLLILDEATNALDRENEQSIADALAALRGTMTTVVISHSDALVRVVDSVVEMADGRVKPA